VKQNTLKILGIMALAFIPALVSCDSESYKQIPAQVQVPDSGNVHSQKTVDDRLLTVHLQGVFKADTISLIPFDGMKALYASPVGEASDIKNNQTAVFNIPKEFLPGELILRINYRAKETDHPYPAERSIFVNNQDIEIFANPLYISNSNYTTFGSGEKENTAYNEFMLENSKKRMPVEILKQFLLTYDRTQSAFYAKAEKEFEDRRLEYNNWLFAKEESCKGLYVANLFQFQYIPGMDWQAESGDIPNKMLENYFEGIDLNNSLIIATREMSMFMNNYMGLYGIQAKTEEARNQLFTTAGRIACEKASKGHPKVYGWMVDYFYNGYETFGIKDGMLMLKEHADNPACPAKKKQNIIESVEGMTRLSLGSVSPDFTMTDSRGEDFKFHNWKPASAYKLIIFSLTDCSPCKRLIKDIATWYNEPNNKDKLDVVIIDMVDSEEEAKSAWQAQIPFLPIEWKRIYAIGALDSLVAKQYAVLSAPAMFLIKSKDNTICSMPYDLEQLTDNLN